MHDPDIPADTIARIQSLVQRAPVVLLLKGSAERPFCRFSKKMVDLLVRYGITFTGIDIMAIREQEPELVEQIKRHVQFPTFPQLYLHGALIGGVDIVEEELRSTALVTRIIQEAPQCISLKKRDEGNESLLLINIRRAGTGVIEHCWFDESKNTLVKLFEHIVHGRIASGNANRQPFALVQLVPNTTALDRNSFGQSVNSSGLTVSQDQQDIEQGAADIALTEYVPIGVTQERTGGMFMHLILQPLRMMVSTMGQYKIVTTAAILVSAAAAIGGFTMRLFRRKSKA